MTIRMCFAILMVFFSFGCSMGFVEVKKQENVEAMLARIETLNQRINQVKASLDIRAHGIMASFLHEQADVVIQTPQFMYWSLRSFFGLPSLIVASNGEYLTAYDFSGQSKYPYQKEILSDDTFFEVMDFRLHPSSIINLFTQKIPLEDAKNLQLSIKNEQLSVNADLDDGWHIYAVIDLAADQIILNELRNDALMISYQARYLNYHSIVGINFPSSIVLLAKGKSRFAKLQIEFTHIELNGPLVLPDVFYVRPH